MLGLSWKTILTMSLVTMGVMFVANQVSATSTVARRYLKGSAVSPVPNKAGNSVTIAV